MSSNLPSPTTLPGRIEDALRVIAPFQPEMAMIYVELVARVEQYLLLHGGSRSWATLDVAGFVDAHAGTRQQRVDLCCNLSAMLACVAGSDDLAYDEARPIFVALAQACPDDPVAQDYLALGLAEFTSPEGAGFLDAMDELDDLRPLQ